jgi:hypothetical protein
VRCVYCDLDGTLLGRAASLLRDGEGEFTLLGVRALEACHRAGADHRAPAAGLGAHRLVHPAASTVVLSRAKTKPGKDAGSAQ